MMFKTIFAGSPANLYIFFQKDLLYHVTAVNYFYLSQILVFGLKSFFKIQSIKDPQITVSLEVL